MAIRVIRTAFGTGDKLTELDPQHFEADVHETENQLVNVYHDVEFQEIEGFGGAFTEAGAVTLDKAGPETRRRIIEAYFSPTSGLGYTLCRTHINSCDFSTGNYAYDETDGDVGLEHFSIDRDKLSLIPFIKDAMGVEGADFKLFASPWSPPGWMKDTGKMNQGGKLKPEHRQTWASYVAKYVGAYAAEGIGIWGLTVQNEPKATQTWDSCIFTAEEEAEFVKGFLGPTLEANGMGGVKIIIWDHNKERVWDRVKAAYSDPEASRYIWGAGVHWYSGDHFENLSIVNSRFPDKKILFTEGCVGVGPQRDWSYAGERYAHDIIGNLNNWSVGWTDWNMVLDEKGGPNHVGNYCDAPVRVNTATGKFEFKSSYYYLGHFSKFIRPGAKRLGCSKYTDRLETTAFRNTDGSTAVVVLNRSDRAIPFTLRCDCGIAKFNSAGHSIMSLIY